MFIELPAPLSTHYKIIFVYLNALPVAYIHTSCLDLSSPGEESLTPSSEEVTQSRPVPGQPKWIFFNFSWRFSFIDMFLRLLLLSVHSLTHEKYTVPVILSSYLLDGL